MIKYLSIACILSIAIFAACDVRSGTAKDEMEKFSVNTTVPTAAPPAVERIVEADVVQVDDSIEGGDPVSVNGVGQKKKSSCPKLNRFRVNGSGNTVMLSGICRQIVVNGDNNRISADAAFEIIFNGSDNNVGYSRFPNGKRPFVTDNASNNIVEKTAVGSRTGSNANSKGTK